MERIRIGPLAAFADSLNALVMPTVLIKADPEKRVAFKCSKLGGSPDLPDSLSWPKNTNGKPYMFIAQLNLNEIERSDLVELPATGVLFLFLDLDPEREGSFLERAGSDQEPPNCGITSPLESFPVAVLLQNNPQETRFPKERPDEPESPKKSSSLVKQAFALFGLTDAPAPPYVPFKECAVSFASSISLPGSTSRSVEKLGLSNLEKDAFLELLRWMNEDYYNGGGFGSLRGYADPVQGDVMEIECYLLAEGRKEFPNPIDAEIEAGAAEWTLLLQLDSVDECNMYWGDGLMYVWIRKNDLEAKDFSRCTGILQYT